MSLVYRPKGPALEYAPWACNIFRGCKHGCKYCYAPQILHLNRETFHEEVSLRPAFFERLERQCREGAHSGKQILLCFTCDPYQPIEAELKATRYTIKLLHQAGANVTILTKAPSMALRDLDILYPGRDVIATTLTCEDPARSLHWEPHAELPQQRINAMEIFSRQGFETWVSMEPVLEPRETLYLIEETWGLFDTFKVGKLNYVQNDVDWAKFARDVYELLELYGVKYILKESLTKYLT